MYNQVSVFLLNESYDHTFIMKEKFLSFFLKKFQENCGILEV